MLSVLHLSFWDNVGGSGRAAYRLHTAFRRLGARSRMLVALKATDDPDVRVLGGRTFGRLDRLCGRAVDRLNLQYLFYPSSLMLPRMQWVRDADVLQVYNTHGGYLSHRALVRLSQARPVVWRLSDMWPLTGHCAYSYECERWKIGCGSCPHLDEFPALSRDTSALLWRIKDRTYARSRLTIVSPSQWLAGCVRASPLLSRFPVTVIPNGIDTAVFAPMPRTAARRELGIDPDHRVVMFGAASIADTRKGGHHLQQALERLPLALRQRLTVLLVGRGEWDVPAAAQVKALGSIGDDRQLARAYAAADVFVLPTLAENLPNTALESMACGTPVVAFGVGGVPEAVRHLETGYVVTAGDAVGLAAGMERLLGDDLLRARLGRRSREVVLEEYEADRQARRFLDLYGDLVSERERALA